MTGKDIVLVVDYHAENIVCRQFNEATGQERMGRYPTGRAAILQHVQEATAELAPGGEVVWIMESTTGWARVKELLAGKVQFVLANVLQMPLPPKARRKKTDKIDTGRLLREYLSGRLPRSFTPERWWREVRRLVDFRQDLVERATALKNQIGSLLSHETWTVRENLWSGPGLRAAGDGRTLPPATGRWVALKLEQLELLDRQRATIEQAMADVYRQWPEAQWVDEIRGHRDGHGGVGAGAHRPHRTVRHGGGFDRLRGVGTRDQPVGLHAASRAHRRRRDRHAPAVSADRGGHVAVPDSALPGDVSAGGCSGAASGSAGSWWRGRCWRSIYKMLTARVRFNPGKAA